MEKIYEKETVDRWLKIACLSEQFNTDNLNFFGVKYRQGEFLSEPQKPVKHFQFLVTGSVALYYLDENGTRRNLTVTDGGGLLGDMEFAVESEPVFYTEAVTPVTVLALPMEENRDRLEKDCRFLMYLLRQNLRIKAFTSYKTVILPRLEERLIYYLQNECPCRTMRGMENTAVKLQCSRRQLQRVVRSLEERGRIAKQGRGCYRLIQENE